MTNKGFYLHIQEAITINKYRRKQYAKMSNGKTKGLSNTLILSEMLTKPIARHYDRKGRKYNEKGIMIVQDDFVDMDVAPYEKDVMRRSPWTKTLSRQLKTLLKEFLTAIPKKYKTNDALQSILHKGQALYQALEDLEVENDVHITMIKHVLESICFICKNGLHYAELSDGETISLSGSLVNVHKIALRNSLWMDKWANKFHQQNIGILVNDMPTIPVY